jgi:Holliday junction DNA helicase RuvB
MAERIIQSKKRRDEVEQPTLRPKSLDEYIGQKRVKETLIIALKAAIGREEALDHVLFYGPPGLGKTTLAHIISEELDVHLTTASGPTLEKAKDLAAILTNLGPRDVLFIDEIHRLNRAVEETLYPAMEDYVIDILLGTGPSAKTMQLRLERFTLVGATTRAGLLTGPLRDRFGIVQHLEFYNEEELAQILKRSARVLNVELSPEGEKEIAKRARGTPRVANRVLKRVRDWADVMKDGRIDGDVAVEACESLGVDEKGLDPLDRKFLQLIVEFYDGGPVGIETLAATLNEERDTITDVMEPYLLKIGFIQRTPRGRCITRLGCEHIGVKFASLKQPDAREELFSDRDI